MSSGRQKVIIGLAVWLYWFSLYTYMPILPTYAQDLGAGYQLIGVILGSYGFTQVALRLPLGIISDRWEKRKVFLLAGTGLSLASGLGMWLFADVYALLFFRLLSGLAATGWVLQSVLFVGSFAPWEATKAMGLITAIVNFGEMTAMFVGGLVAQYYGPQQTFLLAAAASLPALAANLAIREKAGPQGREPVKIAEVFAMARDWTLTLPAVLGLLVQVYSFGTVFGFVPLVLKDLGASYAEIGLLPTIFILPGIAASVFSGTFFARRFSERGLVAVCLLVQAAAAFVTPFLGSVAAVLAVQVVAGFARGLVFPILMSLSIKGVAASRQATAMGYFQAIYGLGMFLGPLLVGAISQAAGMDWGFGAVGLLVAAGAAMGAVFLAGRAAGNAA